VLKPAVLEYADEAFDDLAYLQPGSPAGSSADLAAIDAQFGAPSQEASHSSLHLAAAPAAPAQASASPAAGPAAQGAAVASTAAGPGSASAAGDFSDGESADEVEDDLGSMLHLSQSEEEVFAALEGEAGTAAPQAAARAALQPALVQPGGAEPRSPHRALGDGAGAGVIGGALPPPSSAQTASPPPEGAGLDVHQGAELANSSALPSSPDSAEHCSTAGDDSSSAPLIAAGPIEPHGSAAGEVGVLPSPPGPSHEQAGAAAVTPLGGSSVGDGDACAQDAGVGPRDAAQERGPSVERITDAIMGDLVQESLHEMTSAACTPSPGNLPQPGPLTPPEHRGSQVVIPAKGGMDYVDAVSPPTGTGHALVGAAQDSPQPHSQESSPASIEGGSEEDSPLPEAEQPSVSVSSDDFDAADIEPSSSDEDAFDPDAYVIPQVRCLLEGHGCVRRGMLLACSQ
jgi:hypothetical protein